MKIKISGCFFLGALLLVATSQSAPTQAAETAEDSDPSTVQTFGGPSSVPGQLDDDRRLTESLTGVNTPQSYADWKKGLLEKHGFDYSVDYSATVMGATNTLNEEDSFAGGVVRFFGQWDLVGRDSGNTGSFVWKVENRHKYTDIPPSGVKTEIGYVGLISPVFSDIGNRLTNLYWRQNLNQGRIEIIAGFIDTTDWIDVYALAPPWTAFTNFAFATGSATIAPPDEAALGVYFNAMLTDDVYFMAGFADSNSDSTDPFNGFDTFGKHEFLKTLELGLVTSRDRFYLDNTHITYWHADERKEAGVDDGWGVSFSYSHSFDEKWMPFLRGGYADGGGTLLQKSISTGLAYHWGKNNSLIGLGFNWNEPNEDTFGPGLDDQYTVELFTRLQVTQNFQLTPDIQYVKNPALNTTANHSWVLGLRARLVI
ncbi:carbohydrate porin [Gammaproteobacteria bacterium]|nr:carbohydrate porin [Gammaproteobacteria bacterium]